MTNTRGGARWPAAAQGPGRLDLKRIERALSRASELAGRGRAAEAEALCRPVLKAAPRLAAAHFVAGEIAEAKKQSETAIESYRRATVLDRDYYPGWLNLGVCLRDRGDYKGAVAAYEQAIRIDPRSAQAYNNLASAQVKAGDFAKAIENFEHALKLRPGSVEIRSGLATLYIGEGRLSEALQLVESALEIDDSDASIWETYGRCMQVAGRFKEAEEKYSRALELDPSCVGAHRALARMRRSPEVEEQALRQIEGLLAGDLPTTVSVAGLHFAAADLHDRRGNHDEAFGHYLTANVLQAEDAPFSKEEVVIAFNALTATFTRELLSSGPYRPSPSCIPVFIVGMPRSGTTLTEQIIASHPNAAGAGELKAFDELLKFSARIDADRNVFVLPSDVEAAQVIDGYLATLTDGRQNALRVTDKMPFNFLNLGMIHLLFPNAKIIHCRRDPMDICLSCFCQNFSEQLSFTMSLESLGFYYRFYDDLMQHWKAVLPGRILDVDYERLTEDSEAAIREILEYCELPWDDACLAPHETERQVRTASVWQVRQPIYRTSVAKWKKFEKHLGPLKEALGDRFVDANAGNM